MVHFKKHARISGITGIAAAIALWFIAPYFHGHGHSDEAAWVQLFMIPTLVLCVLFGVLFAIFRKTTLSVLLILLLVAHLMVSLGFHPR